jgi:WD40 repeat protein
MPNKTKHMSIFYTKFFKKRFIGSLSKISWPKNTLMLFSLTVAAAIAPFIYTSSAISAKKTQPIPNTQPFIQSLTSPQLLYIFYGHTGTIKSLTFSPDSRILASGGAENDGIIRLWNTETGKKLGIINRAQKTAVESLVISPDGQNLISCSDDDTINLWNLRTSKFTRSFVGHTSNVLSLAVTPDSKVLVSGALDGIRLWDLLQQRPLFTLAGLENSVYRLALSPDGQTLASGDGSGEIKLWDLKAGKLIATFPAHSDTVSSLAFTPDGKILVSASRDHTIKLWNIYTGELVRTLIGKNWINAIAISPNGQTLASAGRDGLKLWNLSTGELINTLYGHSDWVSTVAFSPDGTMLASGGFDAKVVLWRIH